MLKTISFSCIALMLIFSILAPSIMPLLSSKHDVVVLVDINEEEKNQEKEFEKKLDEKDLFLPNFASSYIILFRDKNLNHIGHTLQTYSFNTEIIVPPPKKLG